MLRHPFRRQRLMTKARPARRHQADGDLGDQERGRACVETKIGQRGRPHPARFHGRRPAPAAGARRRHRRGLEPGLATPAPAPTPAHHGTRVPGLRFPCVRSPPSQKRKWPAPCDEKSSTLLCQVPPAKADAGMSRLAWRQTTPAVRSCASCEEAFFGLRRRPRGRNGRLGRFAFVRPAVWLGRARRRATLFVDTRISFKVLEPLL